MKKNFWRLMEAAGEGGEGGGEGGGTNAPWYDGFQDAGVKDWLKSYGEAYPNPESVAQKAYNLEKFVGADKAGRGVIAPKPDATPEEWSNFYRKVGGVPEKPDGYKVDEKFAADPMVKKFMEHAHKAGMPPTFFKSALDWYTSEMGGMQAAQVAEFERKSEQDLLDLKTDWPGVEYDKNIEMGRRAAKQFIPHANAQELSEAIGRIEGALGTKDTLKLWASIGQALGEDKYVAGEGDGGMRGMSAEGARVRIDQLKKDSGWNAKFASGDSEARAEWDRLHKIAFSQ